MMFRRAMTSLVLALVLSGWLLSATTAQAERNGGVTTNGPRGPRR